MHSAREKDVGLVIPLRPSLDLEGRKQRFADSCFLLIASAEIPIGEGEQVDWSPFQALDEQLVGEIYIFAVM